MTNYPTRQMSNFELSDVFRNLERQGVKVPFLQMSNFSPSYVNTTPEGVEIYRHAGITLEVKSGEVIDSHGNVVNLKALKEVNPLTTVIPSESKPNKYAGLIMPESSRDRCADLTFTPSSKRSRYADLFMSKPTEIYADLGNIKVSRDSSFYKYF